MTRTLDDFRVETRTAVEAAQRAGEMLRAGTGRDSVTVKGDRDIVTATDTAIESEIRSIAATRLGISVVGEELGGEPPVNDAYWLVDPLCGTANFAAGIPLYCTNIAVVLGGTVIAGVVADANGGLLVAEAGLGAWSVEHGRCTRVTTSAAATAVVIEAGRSTDRRRAAAGDFTAAAISTNRWDVMALNSTVSLAYVAAGRVAAYALFAPAALHLAAGTALVMEAGGVVTDLGGAPWSLQSQTMLAAADEDTHRALLALIKRADARG